ncbi:MAG: trigger factor [Candidatus Gracilibacteria bacterium]
MQVTLQTQEKSQIKVTVELTAEEMKAYRVKALAELQDKVKVPGFRAGKIPENVLVEQIGEQAFMSQVLDIALSESYTAALIQEKLRPVAHPKVEILAHDPLKYEALVPVLPEVKFKKEPEKLQLTRKEVEVKEEELEEVLQNFMKRTVEWKDLEEGAAQKGHRVEVDFDGQDMEGVPLEGTSSKNHPVILGEGSLIPGFEDELVGMKKGEEKDFEIVFPKDYHSEKFKSKKVKFHVKIGRIEEGKADELNDAFAQKVSGDEKKTLPALKEEIKHELHHQKEYQEDLRLENEFLKELLDLVEAEVPEALVEKEIDFLIERLKEDLKQRKQSWEDYEKEMKEAGKDLRKELEKPALEQVLVRLALERLFEMENPEVTEADIEEEIDRLLSRYPAEFRVMLKSRYAEGSREREMVHSGVRLRKIVKAHTK